MVVVTFPLCTSPWGKYRVKIVKKRLISHVACATHPARDKPDYRVRFASDIWNRSLTASLNFCLHPMYRSVVWTEA
jgi:hypothetical protein